MQKIKKIINSKEKIACFTLDFEMDYGDRVGHFNIIKQNQIELNELINLFRQQDIPISAFIRTDLLENYPSSHVLIRKIANDYHCHSHTHNNQIGQTTEEIIKSSATFKKHFGYQALGYRAPQGVLQTTDIATLEICGFKFSSSIFPSFRPGKFNNLQKPTCPFFYQNGILELPFAVIKKIHYPFSISYLKLLGLNLNKILINIFDLPNVVILDSHLHDFIINKNSFAKLPPHIKMAYQRNKYKGKQYFIESTTRLKNRGYRFVTMTELYNLLA